MRKGLLLLPALLLFTGCEALNPAIALREAARQLRFSLDRVEPRLDLAWPLDQSRLHLGLVLGVENPSGTKISARGLKGDIALAQGGSTHAIGRVLFPEGVNLEPKARGTLRADLSLSYSELKAAWEPLRKAVVQKEAAQWKLDGTAQLDAFGLPFEVPFHTTKDSGK
ncbi:MAG TPA: hypothetical protein VJ623_15330 [Holophagaceae bacterium]|nr:hypothetical protein [Holophagaceae bacterium]